MVVNMNNPIYIYGLVDPRDNQIKYIGSTNNIKKRLEAHTSRQKNDTSKRSMWIKELVALNFKPIPKILLETTHEKRIFIEESFIKHYRQFCDLKNFSDEKRNTEGTFKPNVLRDFDFEKERKRKAKEAIQVGVVQYDMNNNKLKEWKCMEDAAKHTKTIRSSISECAHGKRKTANKFIWKLKNTANV